MRASLAWRPLLNNFNHLQLIHGEPNAMNTETTAAPAPTVSYKLGDLLRNHAAGLPMFQVVDLTEHNIQVAPMGTDPEAITNESLCRWWNRRGIDQLIHVGRIEHITDRDTCLMASLLRETHPNWRAHNMAFAGLEPADIMDAERMDVVRHYYGCYLAHQAADALYDDVLRFWGGERYSYQTDAILRAAQERKWRAADLQRTACIAMREAGHTVNSTLGASKAAKPADVKRSVPAVPEAVAEQLQQDLIDRSNDYVPSED